MGCGRLTERHRTDTRSGCADSIEAYRVAVHPFAWFDAEQVWWIPMFDDTRQLAKVLFGCVEDVAAGRGAPVLSALAR